MNTRLSLRQRFQIWRLRPGVLFASKLAEQQAWGHRNAAQLGPEQNLLMFSHGLIGRLLDAEEGDTCGLSLSPVTSMPPGWVSVEDEQYGAKE